MNRLTHGPGCEKAPPSGPTLCYCDKKNVAICSSCIRQNMLNTLSVERKEQLKEIPLLKFNNCCIERAKFSTLHSQKSLSVMFRY